MSGELNNEECEYQIIISLKVLFGLLPITDQVRLE